MNKSFQSIIELSSNSKEMRSYVAVDGIIVQLEGDLLVSNLYKKVSYFHINENFNHFNF